MMTTMTLPRHSVLRYTLNEIGCYELVFAPVGFYKMPPVMKIEPTQTTDRIRTQHLLRGRNGQWDRRILTGIAPIGDGWFYGDHFANGKKSLIVFHFSADKRELIAYYCANFYPMHRTQRGQIIQQFIQEYQ